MGGTRGASSGNDERFTQALARGFVFLSRGEFVRQTSIITLTERHRVSARVNDGMRRRAVLVGGWRAAERWRSLVRVIGGLGGA